MLDDLDLLTQEDNNFLNGLASSFLKGDPLTPILQDEEEDTEDLFWNDVDWWTGESTEEPIVKTETTVTPGEMKTFKEQEAGSPAAFRAFETATTPERWFKKYENGRIPENALMNVGGIVVRPDAGKALRAMKRAARKDGVNLVGSGYRTYEEQVRLKQEKPTLAATPGTSNHGWGLAIDFSTSDPKILAWLNKHGHEYGLNLPDWAAPGGSKEEPWHWEYTGSGSWAAPKKKPKPTTTTSTTKGKAKQLGAKDLNDPVPIGRGLTFATAIESLNEMEPVVMERGATQPSAKDMKAASRFLKLAPQKYQDLFTSAARRYNMPVGLLVLVAQHESGFDPNAQSPAGALGIMQIMPQYHHLKDYFDPKESIFYGARYLSNLRQEYGNWRQALAAYNAGGGNLPAGYGYADAILSNWNKR